MVIRGFRTKVEPGPKVEELKFLLDAWREKGPLIKVKSCDVVPDSSNRGHTGLSIDHVHFIASNIYASVCTTYSLRGYIMMPFMIVTPHCSALRWIIQHTGEQIGRWWIWLGGYLVLHITKTIPAYLQMKPLEKEENTDDETTQTTRRERRKNGIN